MITIKKEALIILFAFLFLISFNFIYAQEFDKGCCINPGAGILSCSTERLIEKNECCPTPVSANPSYYDPEASGPANHNNCTDNFFFPEQSCQEVSECQEGCCCTTIGAPTEEKKSQALCTGSGQEFRMLPEDKTCLEVCEVPECNDNLNNDPENNNCKDYPADSGCTSSSDPTESGGTCLATTGQNCNSINYIPKITNFRALPVKGYKEIMLQWESECYSNVISHDISRCKGSGCDDFSQIGTTIENTFIDEDEQLKFQATYTYKIISHYSIQTAQSEKTATVFSGNLECWNEFDSNNFCIHESHYNQHKDYLIDNFAGFSAANFLQNVRSTFATKLNRAFFCTDANVLTEEGTECSSNHVCAISTTGPTCIERSDCDPETSNLFGLFFTRSSCEQNQYCFYDRSSSTVDSCFSCSPQMFCYDYKSRQSCEKDNCYVGNCAWKPLSVSDELGTGVCIDESADNCQWCDSVGTEGLETIRTTSIIFEQCIKEKAEKLSSEENICYYDGQKALNCKDVICTNYPENDCKINDQCDWGICEMFGNLGCRKNADGDDKPDCDENDIECEQDVFAPNTTIMPIIDRGMYKSLLIAIFDKTSSKSSFIKRTTNDYKTFICAGSFCEPKNGPFTNSYQIIISNTNLFDALTGEKLLELGEGTNILNYYSQDPSKNIGTVKTVEVTAHADSSGPIVRNLNITDGRLIDSIYYTNSLRPIITINFFEEAIVTAAQLLLKGSQITIIPDFSAELKKAVEFTFPRDINPGEYIFEVNAKNSKKIFMDEALKADIVIDNQNPEIASISPAQGAIVTDSNVPITINFNKKSNLEKITINGEDVTGQFSTKDNIAHTATITLEDGNKKIQIIAKDFSGNGITYTSTFIVNAKPLEIFILEPSFGVSPEYTFDLVIGTDNDAKCGYNLDSNLEFEFMDKFDISGGTEHKISVFNKIPGGDKSIHKLYVRCNDPTKDSGIEVFDLSVDPENPRIITAYATPNPIVEEPRTTTLKIETNKEAICKYSIDSNDFSSIEGNFIGIENNSFSKVNKKKITVTEDKSYTYFVACMSKAELISDIKQIAFSSDISLPIKITSHTPPYSNSTTIILALETNKKSQCKYSAHDPAVNQGTPIGQPAYSHTKTLTLSPGKHAYYVICKDSFLQKWSDPLTIGITIDTTPPFMVFVDDTSTLANNPQVTWRVDMLRASWLGKDNETEVKSYMYTLEEFGTLNTIIDWTTSFIENEWIWAAKKNLTLFSGSKYFFRVKAKNIVGLLSEALESDGITIDPSLKPTNCSNSIKDLQESDIDCGGSCDLCAEDKACRENTDCFSGFCNANNVCTKPRCNDNVTNQDESDIDCGGNSCEKCANSKECNIDPDCSSDFCSFGICKEAEMCSDGKLSGTESDIDCGGACPNKCNLGQSCDTDTDCQSDIGCVSGTCSEELIEEGKDTDGDGIPDRWELQQGLDPNDPSDAELDFDNDGLTNLEEYTYRTNPNKADTDGDGASDKKEIDKGTDPLDPLSKPKSILGILMWIFIIILLLGGSSYGAYFYYQNYMNKPKPLPVPRTTQKLVQIKRIPKTLEKKAKKDDLFKKKQEEKWKKRERLFEVFGKKKENEKTYIPGGQKLFDFSGKKKKQEKTHTHKEEKAKKPLISKAEVEKEKAKKDELFKKRQEEKREKREELFDFSGKKKKQEKVKQKPKDVFGRLKLIIEAEEQKKQLGEISKKKTLKKVKKISKKKTRKKSKKTHKKTHKKR